MNGYDIIKSSEAVHGVGSVIWLQEPIVISPVTYYRRKRYDIIQLVKIVAHIEDTEVKKFGIVFNDNNTRDHIFKFQKQRCNRSFRQQTFPVRCIDDWNNYVTKLCR